MSVIFKKAVTVIWQKWSDDVISMSKRWRSYYFICLFCAGQWLRLVIPSSGQIETTKWQEKLYQRDLHKDNSWYHLYGNVQQIKRQTYTQFYSNILAEFWVFVHPLGLPIFTCIFRAFNTCYTTLISLAHFCWKRKSVESHKRSDKYNKPRPNFVPVKGMRFGGTALINNMFIKWFVFGQVSFDVFKEHVLPSVHDDIFSGWSKATPESLLIALYTQRKFGVCIHITKTSVFG